MFKELTEETKKLLSNLQDERKLKEESLSASDRKWYEEKIEELICKLSYFEQFV
jgi:hypothetical protein